jgi:hypothetical protein
MPLFSVVSSFVFWNVNTRNKIAIFKAINIKIQVSKNGYNSH